MLLTTCLRLQVSCACLLPNPRKASSQTESCRCLDALGTYWLSHPLDVYSLRRIKLKWQRNIPVPFEINVLFCTKIQPKRKRRGMNNGNCISFDLLLRIEPFWPGWRWVSKVCYRDQTVPNLWGLLLVAVASQGRIQTADGKKFFSFIYLGSCRIILMTRITGKSVELKIKSLCWSKASR